MKIKKKECLVVDQLKPALTTGEVVDHLAYGVHVPAIVAEEGGILHTRLRSIVNPCADLYGLDGSTQGGAHACACDNQMTFSTLLGPSTRAAPPRRLSCLSTLPKRRLGSSAEIVIVGYPQKFQKFSTVSPLQFFSGHIPGQSDCLRSAVQAQAESCCTGRYTDTTEALPTSPPQIIGGRNCGSYDHFTTSTQFLTADDGDDDTTTTVAEIARRAGLRTSTIKIKIKNVSLPNDGVLVVNRFSPLRWSHVAKPCLASSSSDVAQVAFGRELWVHKTDSNRSAIDINLDRTSRDRFRGTRYMVVKRDVREMCTIRVVRRRSCGAHHGHTTLTVSVRTKRIDTNHLNDPEIGLIYQHQFFPALTALNPFRCSTMKLMLAKRQSKTFPASITNRDRPSPVHPISSDLHRAFIIKMNLDDCCFSPVVIFSTLQIPHLPFHQLIILADHNRYYPMPWIEYARLG
ncbi:hypothetical protein CLF_109485 [Clonorchis sinensis]|uniref:Uncharacterized protein n=1 Tax=Clonorchis sinensis TaxID=79923 RepID=G7YJE3_CLOSI|nr:hypothetical protein CLF_109485 [Clonorchis sinensis]